MPSASSRLEILIAARDQASGPIKQIEGSLQGLNKAAGSVAGGMSGLLGAAGIAGIGALGVAAAASVVDMAKGAAEAERLGTAFDTLAKQAGQSGDAMVAAMRQASQGTISNTELMRDANKAMLLGVADSATEMAQLMDVAAARGKAMGESTGQAFGDIVRGIGTMQKDVLDNLGITINLAKVYTDYAQSLGTTADRLDDVQKRQAIFNSVIKDSTDLVKANKDAGGDAASNYERMDAAITNAKDALGQLFSPAVAAIAQDLADAANTMTDIIDPTAMQRATQTTSDLWKEVQRLTQEYQIAEATTHAPLLSPEQTDAAQQQLQNATGQLMAYGREYNRAAAIAGLPLLDLAALQKGIMAFDEAATGLQKVAVAATAAGMGLDGMGQRLPWLVGQLGALTAQSDAARQALLSIQSSAVGALQSAAEQAVPVLGADKVSSMYDERKKKLNEQIEILTRYGYSTDQATFKALELEKAAAEPFVSAVAAAKEAETANTHAAASVDQLSKAYEDLRGKVQGVLQGALDTGTGVDAQKALEAMGFPREDAINENARRLADIAQNGLKNQDWLGQFQQEVPDIWKMIRLAQNPQEEAAHLLQDFQDGLLTSPIDKTKAKEIVRRQIMGDQNMADFANEIAGELSTEMGIPLQEALAAAQGTIGGGAGMGGQVATQFSDGAAAALDSVDGGGGFVSKFTDQARAAYPLLAQAGKDAGKLWGSAFLETVGQNVPPALISILVNLVSPGVMAQMAQKSTLTGATP